MEDAGRVGLLMLLTDGERRLLGRARIHILESKELYEGLEYERSARCAGLISRESELRELVEIHGEGGRDEDWTGGSIALANEDMDSLYAFVEVGTPVTIVGGIGKDGALSDFSRYYRERGLAGAP